MDLYNSDWQSVQRLYALICLLCVIACGPLFTEEHAEQPEQSEDEQYAQDEFEDDKTELVYNIINMAQAKLMIKGAWMTGLFFISCANNAILIHLVSANKMSTNWSNRW